MVKTIAGADAGFTHSAMNQPNPVAMSATPLVEPPWRHNVHGTRQHQGPPGRTQQRQRDQG